MTAFVEAMRRELGGVIADATATRLHAILGDDRPLTARLVRESIDEAVRMAQSGLNGRDRFLSDIDPRHGFFPPPLTRLSLRCGASSMTKGWRCCGMP